MVAICRDMVFDREYACVRHTSMQTMRQHRRQAIRTDKITHRMRLTQNRNSCNSENSQRRHKKKHTHPFRCQSSVSAILTHACNSKTISFRYILPTPNSRIYVVFFSCCRKPSSKSVFFFCSLFKGNGIDIYWYINCY